MTHDKHPILVIFFTVLTYWILWMMFGPFMSSVIIFGIALWVFWYDYGDIVKDWLDKRNKARNVRRGD